jgi:subtilisin family serine protease
MSARSPFVATLLLILTLIASGLGTRSAYGSPPGPIDSSDRPATRSLTQRWIVRLAEPPLAQVPGSSPEFAVSALRAPTTGRLQVNSAAAQQYRATLAQQQQTLFTTLQNRFPGAQMQRSYQVVFNGMSVALPGIDDATAMARLRALPGVVAVYPDQPHDLHMYSSLPAINAPALWNSPAIGGEGNAGAGVKIAILDSGIKIDNPFFDPAGLSYPPGYPQGDVDHTTPKVIAARAYFRPDAPPLPGGETPQPGPEDSSHGTHVAGTVAGVSNTSATIAGVTQTISGVAPRAHLMNYKVFYANESAFSGSGFTTELIAALEDAVADGADIINNSWGGRAGEDPSVNPIALAAEAAVDAGVTVVFSGGNSGPSASTAGSPAYSDRFISVGATTTAQTIAAGFVDIVAPEGAPDTLRGRPYAPAAFGAPIAGTVFGPAPYLPVELVGGTSLACEPLPPGSLDGQIALIERGTCEFSVKVFNAQLGGARAAMVYNSEAGGETLVNMAPGENSEAVTIPAVFVPRSMGVGMRDWYAQHGAAALVQIDPQGRVIDQTPDVIAEFSSRGPTFQGSLKPDVMAPGVSVLSAGFANAEGIERHLGFGLSSGTSMAAPHVAGSAALLKQIHPDWSPADIKSALMSTAVTDVWLDQDRTQRASVLEQGAGRIDVARAANPGLLFSNAAFSFGSIARGMGESVFRELTVTARNVSGAPQTYTLTTRSVDGPALGMGVTPATLTLGPGESADITLAIEMPADAPAGDYGGLVELAGGPQALHLPIWARLQPSEAGPTVLLLDNDGSSSFDLPDYAGYYGNALGELRVPFTYLDLDALAGQAQTLPPIEELQRYAIIIWFTGDNFVPSGALPVPVPLTEADQNLLIAYLQSGGNLIATGQNLTEASDIEPFPPDPRYGRSDLYHVYLGPRFVQEDVFTNTQTLERTALGTAEQDWLADMVLDLSAPGADIGAETSAGNQVSVDEIALSDVDPRQPSRYVTPIFRAVSTGSELNGVIAVNTAAEPTLEQPALGIPYRSTYLAFGLEGVRSDTGVTTRKELLQAILYWHVDQPTVQLTGPTTITAADQYVTFTAEAQSNTPTEFVRYRWDFGDGTPIVETREATVIHRYAQPGNYQPRVEATNSWGHRAIAVAQPGTAQGPSGDIQPQQAAPAPQVLNPRTFPETGQTLSGRFLDYWQRNGGLPVFGYPITPQVEGEHPAQVFERARFEHHPENAPPYDVLLGRIGVATLEAQGRTWWDFPTVDQAAEGCRYFAETRHSLCGAFLTYWEEHGLEFDGQAGSSFAESLALFGMPISEPQEELIEGELRLVQWFERARFEYHPENAPPYDVLLGRLGVAELSTEN